jgi:DNA-binding transcriptional regulator LsrR (DeoR family)
MSKDQTGAAAQLREFFKRNPGEELRTTDIALKFGLTDQQLHALVKYLRKRGEIEIETVRVVRLAPSVGLP